MKKILQLGLIGLASFMFSQTEKQMTIDANSLKKITFGVDNRFKNKSTNISKSPTDVVITPLNQTIASGASITDITSTPAMTDSYSKLDVVTGGSGTLITNANNGIFFDISNSGSEPLRVTGFDFVLFASTATTATESVPFTFYKTTSATTAVGNYTTSSAWTNLTGSATISLPATAASSGYIITSYLGSNEFVLAAGESVGFYIVCNNAATTGWKLGYRTGTTTGAPITDGSLTVTHRARGTGLFATDTTPVLRGFYGNVYYYKGYIGSWTRDNITNVVTNGTGNAGDEDNTISTTLPGFPITGGLINNTTSDQVVNYTIEYFDVDNNAYQQIAQVTVQGASLSVSDAIKNSLVRLFPNPATDVININSQAKINSVKMTDFTGKSTKVNLNGNQIDIRNLAKGVYILNVETDKGTESVKFIKK